jgi:hypothetical protein
MQNIVCTNNTLGVEVPLFLIPMYSKKKQAMNLVDMRYVAASAHVSSNIIHE